MLVTTQWPLKRAATSPHLSGFVFYGCLESLTELSALCRDVTCEDHHADTNDIPVAVINEDICDATVEDPIDVTNESPGTVNKEIPWDVTCGDHHGPHHGVMKLGVTWGNIHQIYRDIETQTKIQEYIRLQIFEHFIKVNWRVSEVISGQWGCDTTNEFGISSYVNSMVRMEIQFAMKR